jgi:hypothetical protein
VREVATITIELAVEVLRWGEQTLLSDNQQEIQQKPESTDILTEKVEFETEFPLHV